MTLSLTFSVDRDQTLDTLEAVLAIARRIGLRMLKLDLREHGAADLISLALQGPSGDHLALFGARLHNLIGVHDIALDPPTGLAA